MGPTAGHSGHAPRPGLRCGFGREPTEAREAALQNRKLARAGGDPLATRKKAEAILTFEAAAEKVHALHLPTWRNPKHGAQWITTLREYVFPHFGSKRVDAITSADVLSAMAPIWNSRPETARRVRQRICAVLKWAIANGWRTDNPAEAISKALPKHDRMTVQHRKALSYQEPACVHCRRRYVKRQFKAAIARFGGTSKSDMAFVSIVLDGVQSVDGIGSIVSRARSTMKNMFDKYRGKSKRWSGVEFLGWFEVDAISAEDVSLLGTERLALLSLLGSLPSGNVPTYIPTIHGMVALNGLDYQQFRDSLQEKWPHAFQVDARPFYPNAPIEKSLYCCNGLLSLKRGTITGLADFNL